jgi:hypothetical protein
MQSEIIPVQMVARRRMPISESNNRFSLPDLLTGNLGATLAQAGAGAGVGAGVGAYGGGFQGALKGAAAGAGLMGLRKLGGSQLATKGLYALGKPAVRASEAAQDIAKLKPSTVVQKSTAATEKARTITPAYSRQGINPDAINDVAKAERFAAESAEAEKIRLANRGAKNTDQWITDAAAKRSRMLGNVRTNLTVQEQEAAAKAAKAAQDAKALESIKRLSNRGKIGPAAATAEAGKVPAIGNRGAVSAFERAPDLEQRAGEGAERILQSMKGTPATDAATVKRARQYLSMLPAGRLSMDKLRGMNEAELLQYARIRGFEQ